MPKYLFKKGHVPSLETRIKISNALKAKGIKPPGYIPTLESKKNQSLAKLLKPTRYWLGKPRKELINKMNERKKELGIEVWNKGKEFHQIKGNKNPNWRGGITKLTYKIRDCFRYKQWRSDIFKRDNWTCQICNKRGCYLEAHHSLKKFSEILFNNGVDSMDKAYSCIELWDVNNGVTLCIDCHNLTKRRICK